MAPGRDRVTTPTIFLGGREDWNVPVLNAELVYPDTHHGDWSPEFERDYLNRVREWFDKYLQ